VPSTRERPREPLSRAPAERCLAGQRWQPPHVFIDVRERSTRPLTARFRVLARGRVRSSGFCRAMFPRARPWAARTPRPPNCGWGDCLAGPGCPDPRQSPKQAGGQGPRRTVPRALPATIARHEDFAPTSTVSSASCRDRRSLTLSGVTWGVRGAAIAARACRARERQGRATPSFREETRRSPARGTFRRKVVRGRTKAFCRSGKPERECSRRLFHRRGVRARDARAKP
jgi:hypothetical protein